jgi:hypothetical protein
MPNVSVPHPFLSFGDLRPLHIVVGKNPSPPSGRRWLFLCGIMNHITGTASSLNVANVATSPVNVGNVGFVEAAKASAPYPIPNLPYAEAVSATNALVTNVDHPAPMPYVLLDETLMFALSGDATATADILVLEVLDYKTLFGIPGPSAPSPLGPSIPVTIPPGEKVGPML